MKYIDLSHKFTAQMPVYPGDQAPSLEKMKLENVECNDYRVETGMHVGTHIDAPLHMIPGAKRICDFPIEHFFGKVHLLDAVGKDKIDVDLLDNSNIEKGDIVFVKTLHSEKFRSEEYYKEYPLVTEEFAQRLVDLGVKIFGVDTPSPDVAPFPVHKLLFQNDILLIENLNNLKDLPGIFNVAALPINFEAEASPVRVVGMV